MMDELIQKIMPLKQNIRCILADDLTFFSLLNNLKFCVKSSNCSSKHPITTPIKLYTFLKIATSKSTYMPISRCYSGFHVSFTYLF